MKVYSIKDLEFKEYGQVLEGYDFSEMLEKLKKQDIPESGIVYEPSIEDLENCVEKNKIQIRGFGGMPIQIGFVGGNNRKLNCLEYHKSSEFNIAADDIVLVLGKQSQICDGKFDTSLCKAFYVPKGMGVELFATTLHYAPMNVENGGYRVICVLPKGTNYDIPEFDRISTEDEMCAGSNKWLICHSESDEAKQGKYIGIQGDNIAFDKLKF